MRILIAEDDPALAATLVEAMRQNHHAVDTARDGRQADHALNLPDPYDLAILDLGLPYMDGLEVLQRLRQRGNRTPVLILTARDDIDHRVRGLDLGADDYMTKPFALPELEARVRALLRRAGDNPALLSAGPLTLDTTHRQATLGGEPLPLSVREMEILEALMQRLGQVVIKSRLANRLSDWDSEIGPNAIEVYIHRLRKKLDAGGVRIRTIHGLGYLLEVPVETA